MEEEKDTYKSMCEGCPYMQQDINTQQDPYMICPYLTGGLTRSYFPGRDDEEEDDDDDSRWYRPHHMYHHPMYYHHIYHPYWYWHHR